MMRRRRLHAHCSGPFYPHNAIPWQASCTVHVVAPLVSRHVDFLSELCESDALPIPIGHLQAPATQPLALRAPHC